MLSHAGRDRRSVPFSFELARKAATVNGATHLAVTKLDCAFPECKCTRTYKQLPTEAKKFIERIKTETSIPVSLTGTGPDSLDLIDRRE